ncbi:MAG: hypothetical protein AAGL66_09580, partial [Pseudomonadota bacterium]
ANYQAGIFQTSVTHHGSEHAVDLRVAGGQKCIERSPADVHGILPIPGETAEQIDSVLTSMVSDRGLEDTSLIIRVQELLRERRVKVWSDASVSVTAD